MTDESVWVMSYGEAFLFFSFFRTENFSYNREICDISVSFDVGTFQLKIR